MNWKLWTGIVMLAGYTSLAGNVAPQPPKKTPPPPPDRDLGTIKIKAEAGDVDAQVKLGDACRARSRFADALQWYQTAALNKSIEGEFQYGRLLTHGSEGGVKSQQVDARPFEGIRWVYTAATNGNHGAWREMALARQTGTGCSKNPVEAYAWWMLLQDSKDNFNLAERDRMMTDLVLKLPGADIERGKKMAAEMKARHWPALEVGQEPAVVDVELRLNGLSLGGKSRLAIINGKTLSENESALIQSKNGKVKIRCLKIDKKSVSVRIEGESEPRVLNIE